MSENAPGGVENQERITSGNEMLGFQGRVLAANQEYLNPRKNVPPEDKNSRFLTSLVERNYSPFQNTSEYDRGNYWVREINQGRVDATHAAQMTRWRNNLVSGFSAQNSRENVQKLNGFLQNIGGIGPDGFTAANADTIYKRYFDTASGNAGGVRKFVIDVMDVYKKNNGSFDMTKFMQDKSAIQWFATVFGEPSKEIITNLVEAEMRIINAVAERDIQYQENMFRSNSSGKNRINDLSNVETRLLQHIVDHGMVPADQQLPQIVRPATTPTPQPQPGPGVPNPADREPPKSGANPFEDPTRIQEIIDKIKNNPRILLLSGTGTGKTTTMPKIIFEKLLRHGLDKMIISQPTQLNVSTIAEYVAKDKIAPLLGKVTDAEKESVIGHQVGYIHGDDKEHRNEAEEEILFATEGIALHMAMGERGNELQRIADKGGIVYFMIDEVHMRTEPGVRMVYRLMQLQEQWDTDPRYARYKGKLKLIISTATGNEPAYKEYFNIKGNEDTVRVPGVQHEIEELHLPPGTRGNVDLFNLDRPPLPVTIGLDAANKVRQILATPGETYSKIKIPVQNTMVFVPGQGEIDATIRELRRESPGNDVEILPVSGNLTYEEKKAISERMKQAMEDAKTDPSKKKRFVLVCTDAAMTGVTFPAITDVVVSGMGRRNVFVPELGLQQLRLQVLSKAEMTQMKGRTGREDVGRAHFLYLTEDQFNNQLEEHSKAQTETSDLTSTVLSLKIMGVDPITPDHPKLLSKLPKEQLNHAFINLRRLGAIDEHGNVTEKGRYMERQSVDYHLARALYEAQPGRSNCVEQIASITAMLEMQNKVLFVSEQSLRRNQYRAIIEDNRAKMTEWEKQPIHNSDFMVLLRIWRLYEQTQDKAGLCASLGLSPNTMEQIAARREKILKRNGINVTTPGDFRNDLAIMENINKSLAVGYRDHLLKHYRNELYELYYNPRKEGDLNATDWTPPEFKLRADERMPVPSTITRFAYPQYLISQSMYNPPGQYIDRYNNQASMCLAVKPEWLGI